MEFPFEICYYTNMIEQEKSHESLGLCPGAFSYAFCDGCDGSHCSSRFLPNTPSENRKSVDLPTGYRKDQKRKG